MMKKRALSLALALLMLVGLLPVGVWAEGEVTAKPIYNTNVSTGALSFNVEQAVQDEHEQPKIEAYLINTAGELKSDCGAAATMINNVAVTLGEGGVVNTENIYIFDEGSLKVGDVTFTAGHNATIVDDTMIENIMAALAMPNKVQNISGELGTKQEEWLGVYNVTVPAGATLTLGENAHLTISGSFTAATGTVNPSQGAQITVRGGEMFGGVNGIEFYDEKGENPWQSFGNEETFVFIATDNEGHEVNKWVRNNPGPGDDELHDYDYRVIYDQDRGSIFVPGETENSWKYIGDGWRGNFGVGDPAALGTITLKLDNTRKYNNGVEIPKDERVTVHAYIRVNDDWVVVEDNVPYSNTGYDYKDADAELTITPADKTPLEILVCWTVERYEFEDFGVWPYMVEYEVNGNGTVTASSDVQATKEATYGNRTKVGWNTAPGDVVFTVTPNGQDDELKAVWIEQEADGNDNYNALAAQASAFSADGGYKLDLSKFKEEEGDNYFANMSFRFTGWDQEPGPQEPQGPGVNQYVLHYSDMGSVTSVDSEDVQSFTENVAITWTLSANPYRVEINVWGNPGDPPSAHYEYNDGADNNSPEIGINNDEKTISYTPTSTDPFEVFIYWTEQDRFNQFGYDENTETQLRCRVLDGSVYGTDINAPMCDCVQNGGWRDVKINVPKNTDSFTITFANNENYEFDKAELQDHALGGQTTSVSVTNNVYEWAKDNFGKELNVYFKQVGGGGEPGPGPNPPAPQGGVDWSALTNALEGYVFAYAGANADAIKTAMAKELSERRIGDQNAIGVEACALGEVLGKDASQLEGLLTLTGDGTDTDGIISGLPYYTYSFAVEDVDPNTEGNQGFAFGGKVYVLNTNRDIIVKSEKDNAEQYQVATLSDAEFGTTCVYVDADEITGVFGNAAMCNGIDGGGKDVFAAHVTQEHAGGISTFPIGARLVLTTLQDTIRVTCDSDAAPWSFINVGVYSGAGTESEPTEATVFYGTNSVTLGVATGEKTIANVEAVELPAGAVTFAAGTLTFNTAYDTVKIKITYDDQSASYMVINRVGLDINSVGLDKEADVTNSDRFSPEEKAACNGDTIVVWHGSDQSVRYASTADKTIVGTFYYADDTVIDKFNDKFYIGTSHDGTEYDTKAEAVAAYYATLSHVSLYVTVTKNDGSVEHHLVNTALSGGTAVNNGGFIEDFDNAPGYAGQGSNHFYDDFVLWSGSQAEFESIESVSAIAYDAGDADAFGGVKVGSGAGVVWTKEQ